MSVATYRRHKDRWAEIDMVMEGFKHMSGEFTGREVSDWIMKTYGKSVHKITCTKTIERFAEGVEVGFRGSIKVFRKVM